MWRLAHGIVLGVAIGSVGLCLYWPAWVATIEALGSADWASAGLGPRRLTLLTRGVWIALGASGGALLLGAGLAAGLLDRSPRMRALSGFVALFVLLTPPYISAYAISLPLLPAGIASEANLRGAWAYLATSFRAVACLSIWLAPVAAAVLVCGWRSAGHPALALATLDAHVSQAAWRVLPAVMVPWLLLAGLINALLALTEFTVCHLCLVQTWNTEILAEIQSTPRPGAALVLAWPIMAVVGIGLAGLLPLRARITGMLRALATLSDEAPATSTTASAAARIAAVAALLLLGGPLLILLGYLDDWSAWWRIMRVFPHEWPAAVLCAGGATVLSLAIAVGVDFILAAPQAVAAARAAARVTMTLAIAFSLAPPALVGDAFVAAYPASTPIGDSWMVVSLTSAARFAIIPILVLRFGGAESEAIQQAAELDRVGAMARHAQVRLPQARPALVMAGLVVALLSIGEVAASQMTTPPGWPRLSVTLLNQIHFGRNADVIALSLSSLALTGALIVLALWLVRRAIRHKSRPGSAPGY